MSNPYGYAWNAEIVCEDCTRSRLVAALKDEGIEFNPDVAALHDVEALTVMYAIHVLKTSARIGDLDTAVCPQPSWDSETLDDSCGACLTRITDTL